jgi:hypothetical protein
LEPIARPNVEGSAPLRPRRCRAGGSQQPVGATCALPFRRNGAVREAVSPAAALRPVPAEAQNKP